MQCFNNTVFQSMKCSHEIYDCESFTESKFNIKYVSTVKSKT